MVSNHKLPWPPVIPGSSMCILNIIFHLPNIAKIKFNFLNLMPDLGWALLITSATSLILSTERSSVKNAASK